ncbi:MAG: hypothetical protein J6T60_03345 [Bacteroidales bacterium]|nr:hypothetical protein [Bacteroidales bacterium]
MKLLKLIIIITVFLVACGESPRPNQDLLSAYEFLKKGEIDTAKIIAEKAERLTDADSAMFLIVRGAFAAITMDTVSIDSLEIEKSIRLYDKDEEKLAWAHLIKGYYLYYGHYDESLRADAAVEYRTAEKYAQNTNCDELKFHIYLKLSISNINAYNFDFYDIFLEKIRKYAVSNYDTAEYWSQKSFGYDLGRFGIDSAKFCAQKAVEYINKVPNYYSNMFVYLECAELIYEENDSLAEKIVMKTFETDTLCQAAALLGRIYIKRGDENKAKLFFEKSRQQNVYWVENEEQINRLLGEYYAIQKDYKQAYEYALLMAAAKDSLIGSIQEDNVKPVQARFEAEIENLKLKSSFEKKIFLTILISAVILAVLVLVVVFQKYKLAERSRKISETQRTINDYNQKINELQRTNTDHSNEEIKYLQQKVKALEMKFSDIYVRGKELYSQILNNQKIGRWSKEDYKNFIDYYQSLDFLHVYSFETDYTSLTDRQKIFLILLHIGKTKEQVMQIMTIEESSFRSMKSRAEGQRK